MLKNEIRILLVSDDQAELYSYRQMLLGAESNLQVIIYGPEESMDKNRVGEKLIEDLKVGDIISPNAFDVIFVDYSMPGMTGIEFIEVLNEEMPNSKIPVVIVTKHDRQMFEESIKALEIGARGYVFFRNAEDSRASKNMFIKEVEITAKRVYRECLRETWSESVMEITSKISNISSESELFDIVIDVISARNKDIKVFIRKVINDYGDLRLFKCTGNIGEKYEKELNTISAKDYPMLYKALGGYVTRYNTLTEISQTISQKALKVCKKLSLDRGMTFPLIDSDGNVFCTVSMYRNSDGPAFSIIEEDFAKLMMDSIVLVLKARKQRQEGKAYAMFIKEFSIIEDEDKMLELLVKHLHENMNVIEKERYDENKTTIKTVKRGTDLLICNSAYLSHIGAERESDWSPSIYGEKSISSWVFKNNDAVFIEDKELSEHYYSTNENMKSELCIPVATGNSEYDTVYGVVNMESKYAYCYDEANKEYSFALCRLVGKYIERIRIDEFVTGLLLMMGLYPSADDKINMSINIIKKLTNCQLLVFLLKDGDEWTIADLDIPVLENKSMFSKEAQEKMNDDSEMLIKKALNQDAESYYIKDLSYLDENEYWQPDKKYTNGYAVRSQAVFLIKEGGKIFGALSLDFAVVNPLTNKTENLLKLFSKILAKFFMERDRYQALSKKYSEAERSEKLSGVLSYISHKMMGSTEKIHSLYEKIKKIDCGIENCGDFKEVLNELSEYMLSVGGYKAQISSLTGEIRCINFNVNELIGDVISQLKAKADRYNVEVKVEKKSGYLVKTSKEIIEMGVYVALDNAIDACKDVLDKRIFVKTKKVKDGLYNVYVEDNGVGINDIDPSLIGDEELSNKSGGTGRSIYYSRKRLRAVCGDFLLKSKKVGCVSVITIKDLRKL